MKNYLVEAGRFLEDCRYGKRLSEQTIKAYAADLKQLGAYMEERHPELREADQICRSVLNGYIQHLNATYAVQTAKRKYASMKGFFGFLEKEELIRSNPMDKLPMRVKTPKALPDVMTLAELRAILEAAYNAEIHGNWCGDPELAILLHLRDIAVLELLFATGLRVQELCDLKCSDMADKRQFIRIRGKGNKERSIFIGNEEVINALEAYDRQRRKLKKEGKYLFISRFRDKLSPQSVRNLVSKYVELAGITKSITPHTFRHTFASLLLEEGVDIKYIQEFLGHSSISTTQIYLHITPRGAKEVLTSMHPRRKLSSRDWTHKEIEI